MPTPKPEKLLITYVGAGTDGAALGTGTIAAGSTVDNIVTSAALTNAPGGRGVFSANTTTAALRGQRFRVRVAEGSGYRLARSLPAAPAAGDTFLWIGPGSARSITPAHMLTVGGAQPELAGVAGATITGLTILQAAGQLGPGTLTMSFVAATKKVQIKMGTDEYGAELDLSTATSPAYVYDAAESGFLKVSWVVGSLPATDQTETWTLAVANAAIIPDTEGYESAEGVGAVTYYAYALTNTDLADIMSELSAYTIRPTGTATTIAAGSSLGLDAADVTLTDASDWPTAGFWLRNTTKGDCRYVTSRSGNVLTCPKVSHVTLTGNGTSAASVGTTITGATSGAKAVVLSSRPGYAICRIVSGTFQTSETAGALGTLSAVTVGFRGFAAVSWAAGDSVEPMTDLDIASDPLPVEAVTAESQTPTTIAFSAPTEASPLSLGNLGAGSTIVTWLRKVTVAGAAAVTGRRNDLIAQWK
jgi:hypothetical protein